MHLPLGAGHGKISSIISTKRDAGKDYSDSSSDSPRKWIQEVVSDPDFQRGAFKRQAQRHGLTPLEFMEKVLAKPEDYDLKTRRRARFLANIQPKK